MGSEILIGRNIRRLRIAKNISQGNLAMLAGIDRTYVSRLERMIENPSIGILDKIAQALNVKTADLFAELSSETGDLTRLKAGRPRKRQIEPGL